jgi:hypothetical protein
LTGAAGYKIWNSHAYATYGGFVVSPKVGVEKAIEIVDSTITFVKERSANELIVRNPFRIFNNIPTDETDYAMWRKGFSIVRRNLEIAIQLTGFTPQTLFDLYDESTRRVIRKAQKENVQVKMSQDYAENRKAALDLSRFSHRFLVTSSSVNFRLMFCSN